MRLHYNPACPHQHLPLTPLYMLHAAGRHQEVLNEAIRLDKLPLDERLRILVTMYKTMARRAMRKRPYPVAAARLADLALEVQALGNPVFIAQCTAQRIKFAAYYGDHELAAELVSKPRFFAPPVARTAITEAYWRLALGVREQYTKDPGKALPYYHTVVFNLASANRPCLREMAARRRAYCVSWLKDKQTAVAGLRDLNIPASLNPGPREVSLDALLQLPLW